MDDGLTPDLMLYGYAMGIFPMARDANSTQVDWFEPRQRGVIPLDGFHISRSLAKRMRQGRVHAVLNRDFADTVAHCANRDETWINGALTGVYNALHRDGRAHGFEVFDGPTLLGGAFGITLGRAFFGESMFSARTNGSKIALAFLVHHLARCGFHLFDTQFITDHLASLGAQEIPQSQYRSHLSEALEADADILSQPLPSVDQVLQRTTQTS